MKMYNLTFNKLTVAKSEIVKLS